MTSSAKPARIHQRDRSSSWSVNIADRIAKQIITIGGIGTIMVVLLVVLVLFGNVLPLFQRNTVTPLATLKIAKTDDSVAVASGVDEYSELAWVLYRDSTIGVYSIATGESIGVYGPTGKVQDVSTQDTSASKQNTAPEITSVRVAENNASVLVGYADGSIRPIVITPLVEFSKWSDLDGDLAQKLQNQGIQSAGDSATQSDVIVRDGTVIRKLPSGLVRNQSIAKIDFAEPIQVSEKAITSTDWYTPASGSSFDESTTWVWAASDGEQIAMGVIENKVNSFSGQIKRQVKVWRKPAGADSRTSSSRVIGLMLGSRGDSLQTMDSSGRITAWAQTDSDKLSELQSYTTLSGSDSQPTASSPLLGRSTWMIGSQSGHIEAVAMTATSNGPDLLSIHRLDGTSGSILDLAASPSSRIIAGVHESGSIHTFYVPANRTLIEWNSVPGSEPSHPAMRTLFFSADGNTVGTLMERELKLWRFQVPYPESSIQSFFAANWYEGYTTPSHVWQSSTGNIEGEYKFGFMPLLFGTMKATFYSMLIAAPIALLAAIYGSEFMNRKWRARVKPFIELMASVPSVVLGFVGALVLAPILRDNLAWALLSVVSVLFCFLLAAHLWLVLPNTIAIRFRFLRLPIIFSLIPIGIWIAGLCSRSVERLLFGNSILQWLSESQGGAWAGWFCLLLLPMVVFVAWLVNGPLHGPLQGQARQLSSMQFSLLNIGVFLLACAVVIALAALGGVSLAACGLDPRGPVLGPYQERNALLVGAILGFAIIPLIYTISEDALQSVPQHLRSASLGCGATTWQTTIRVVVPTAMSGLFSALMIGFGRAVGETMVVLMAAGNTPVMDINPMNGYRTLSATLATELPEAARGSTHYHALFLAAFLLFCITLVANTLAEVVRMRFRKRAYQL